MIGFFKCHYINFWSFPGWSKRNTLAMLKPGRDRHQDRHLPPLRQEAWFQVSSCTFPWLGCVLHTSAPCTHDWPYYIPGHWHGETSAAHKHQRGGRRVWPWLVLNFDGIIRFHRRGLHKRFQRQGESDAVEKASEVSKVSSDFQVNLFQISINLKLDIDDGLASLICTICW